MAVKQGNWKVSYNFFHVLPNSLLTVVTMLGMSFGGLLGGTMIVETVFSWNGIGSAAVACDFRQRLPAESRDMLCGWDVFMYW